MLRIGAHIMTPLDRRRRMPSFCTFLLCVTLLFSPLALAQSAVLGIDLGTEYIKAALVKPGIPLEIVLTKDSKRKETSAVAFKASNLITGENNTYPERLYGGDAIALTPRIPGDVYPNLKHILAGSATPFGAVAVHAYKQRYPALSLTDGGSQGMLGFKSKTLGSEEDVFSVEEILAMVLKSIRINAQTMAGKHSSIRNAVITVPAYYTADERRAIESAADLAGLKVIGLISDGMAVGINYATSRTFTDPEKGGKAEHHLVYDMGAGSTTATVLKFQARTVKDVGRFNKTIQEVSVLGTGWDRFLGGDALNDLIVHDMVEQFVQSKAAQALQLESSTIRQHGRAMAKLTREAERIRQVLSANTETSAFFEGLYDDVDFRYKLSRSTFESLASTFLDRVGAPITEALSKAGLSLETIDSIILHGGAVRTPFVQSTLEALVGDPARLKSNVNADEAAVFGAAFKAAGLSPSFRVKDIKDRDAASYSATINWVSNGKDKKQIIFQPTSITGTHKQMPFKMSESFQLSITQNVPSLDPEEILQRPVVNVEVSNLTETVQELVSKYGCTRNNITTSISFHLDPTTGLPAVVKGTASCESEITEESSGIIDGVKGLFGFGSKKDQKPLSADEDGDFEEEIVPDLPDASSSSSTSTTTSSATSTASRAAAKESKATMNPKFHSINLKLISTPAGTVRPDSSILAAVKSRLAAFDSSDRARAKRSETFNTLESLTYRVRDLLTDAPFQAASSESQRAAIETLLGTTSEWISTQGAEATYDAIKERLTTLQGLVDPVKARIIEISKRPASLKSLKEALNNTQAMVALVRQQIDQAASVAEESAKNVVESVTSVVIDAASSAAEYLSTDTASTTSTAPTSSTPVASDSPEDLLDTDSTITSSTTTTSSASASSTTKPFNPLALSSFTEEDYISLSSLYTSISNWLADSELAQEGLKAYEDPALLVADVERRSKQLGDASNDILRKMMRRGGSGSSSSKSKSSRTSKFKVPTPKVSIVTQSGASASPEPPVPEPERAPEDEALADGSEPVVAEPESVEKVLAEEANPSAQPVESTTEPQLEAKAEDPVASSMRDEL